MRLSGTTTLVQAHFLCCSCGGGGGGEERGGRGDCFRANRGESTATGLVVEGRSDRLRVNRGESTATGRRMCFEHVGGWIEGEFDIWARRWTCRRCVS